MSLMESNCELMSRAAYAQGALRGDRWTRAGRRQQAATALSMQFDADASVPHADVDHCRAMDSTLVLHSHIELNILYNTY